MSSINQLLRENNPNHEILVIAGKLADKENIREVTLFPMNQNAQDLMMKAPSDVDDVQLKELSIKKNLKKN